MAPRLRIALAISLALLLLVVLHAPARAAWPNNPAINVPVCTVKAAQYASDQCPDGAGGFFSVWQDERGGSGDIYLQRVDASGRTMWAADGVAVCVATGSQSSPRLVTDGAGGVIVVWADSRAGNSDIYAQCVSAAGEVLWTLGGVALCTETSTQVGPQLVADDEGGAIVFWADLRGGATYDIYAQHVNTKGVVQWTADGLAVCSAAENQLDPIAISDARGGAIVVWKDFRNGNWDYYAQRLTDLGAAVWTYDGLAVCTEATNQQGRATVSDGEGGVVLAWYDYRNGNDDIFAQRVNASGVVSWTAGGVTVCNQASLQRQPSLASDGTGGAIVFWEDNRGGGVASDIYAQRVSRAGAVVWTANGIAVCDAAGLQTHIYGVPDGTGGAIAAWSDARGAYPNEYVQRVSALGSPHWAANGLPLCTASGMSGYAPLVSDGAGGAFGVWTDWRSGEEDVYAQHVDQWGHLGVQPTIAGAEDVPNDEGGQVKLSWHSSPLDSFPDYAIFDYLVFRSVPPNLVMETLRQGATLVTGADADQHPGRRALLLRGADISAGAWEYVGSATAYHLPIYSLVVPTACDSVGGSNPMTWFMVEARTAGGTQWWFSDPDSGYSVDNLAPTTPAPFTGEYSNGVTIMSWGQCGAADFAEYYLHRGHGADFVPGSENLVATLTSTGYVDAAGAPFYYKLCAVDSHGNASPFATLLPSGTVGVPGAALPRELALSAPAPNPLRGSCAVQLALPRAAAVTLAVYDQQGRRVRTLLAGAQPAGERAVVWDGRDDGGRGVASGIYFVRCEFEGRTLTRRIAAIR